MNHNCRTGKKCYICSQPISTRLCVCVCVCALSAVCTSSRVISGALSHVHGILSTDGFVVPDKAGGSAPPISS